MDKRKYLRLNLSLQVHYRILESLKPYQVTNSEDMCIGGIRITLPRRLEPETRMELTISIPTEPDPIVAIGRVVWVKKEPVENSFTTGIQLVYVSEENRDRLYKYTVLSLK